MASIVKTFREEVPAMRFIGKKYEGFGPWWGEWFANGWFDEIEKAMGGTDSILKIWENGGGYVGLERRAAEQPFEYWIGMFTPADTPVPEGFSCVDFPAMGLGTCWIYGSEREVHKTKACKQTIKDAGMTTWKDENGGKWSFENCVCPRYTTPDAEGNIIMDYCYFVE
ncbi:MAG: hypothetical protein IJX19_00410 [Clostridia bacterium]|nr:hypothetical protein [Clostridia bacterium]